MATSASENSPNDGASEPTILVPGQVVSAEILSFMRALDVSEIHGYRSDLGLRVFTQDALKRAGKANQARLKLNDARAKL